MPSAFWRTVLRFDASKIDPEIALRNTIGIVVPLILGTLLGNTSAGVVGSLGALNVCYSDSHDPYSLRARRMLLASVVVAIAVTAGAISAINNVVAVLAVMAWAFVGGMFVVLGSKPGDLGTTTVVTFVIFAARSLTPLEAVESGLIAFAGGVLETLLAVAFWPVNPWQPERRTIASVYRTLAGIAVLPGGSVNAPPGTAAMTEAHEAQHRLTQDHSAQAERLSFLLYQAERIRLSLLSLRRIRQRVARIPEEAGTLQTIDQLLQLSSEIAESVSQSVEARHGVPRLAGLNGLVKQLPPNSEARHQADALAGQLRAASGLTAPEAPGPTIAGTRQDPLSRLMRLRANLSLDSTAFRHAVRLAASVGVATAIGRTFGLQRGYWLPMTVAIVLKPDFVTTFSRGVLRIAGTLAGLVLATVLFHFVHLGPWTDVALVTVFALILRWAGPANYGIFVIAISGIAVLLIAITGVSPQSAILARAVNTVLGGILALAAYWVWPTWERTQTGPVIAKMLEIYRDYFRHVIAAHQGDSPAALDGLRRAARLARSNAEASVTRFAAEPGSDPGEAALLNAILVSSHTFVRAVMALESTLYGHHNPPAPAHLSTFCDQIDATVAAVANSLGYRTPLPQDLPDLREAWQRMSESHDQSFLETETDRLTTSLNTLKEQVARRSAGA
jgi:uncharacterized membrane protein YccC